MNMTDAEIKKDLYYYAFNYRNASTPDADDWWLALERHSKELKSITREKVLAELARDNPPVAWKRIYHGAINYLDTDKYAQGDVEPLYAMPPVPEGWKLVPIEPNEDMILAAFNVQRSEWSNPIGHFVSHYKAMLSAAPKKG